jgi:protein Mpv17
MLSEAFLTVENFYITSPYVAAAITCGVKASAADFVAQKRQIRKREEVTGSVKTTFQSARNVAFLIYGALYQGVAQEFIYNDLYPMWFGTSSMPLIVLKKTAFDVFVQTPLLTLPIAYFFKAIVFQHSPIEAIRRYVEDVTKKGLLQKYVLLWAPVQCLTFSVVPPHLRISFIAFVSFFWLIIFSSVSGKRQEINAKESDTCDLVDGTTCNIDG